MPQTPFPLQARADGWRAEHIQTNGQHFGLTGPNTSARTLCPMCLAAPEAMAPAGRPATVQGYRCRCGTAGPMREVPPRGTVRPAPRCNNCGSTMAKSGQPFRMIVADRQAS